MKIALITGGSRGLGRNMAEHLVAQGVDILFTYHSNEAEARNVVAQLMAKGRKAVALQLDTGDVSSFPAFVDRVKTVLKDTWGRDSFDFLVNNAGIGLYNPIADTTEDQFDRLMKALAPVAAAVGRQL